MAKRDWKEGLGLAAVLCAALGALLVAPASGAAVTDFDGDGKSDIAWRNGATGENYLYVMNGTLVVADGGATVGEGFFRTVPEQNWQVAGVGDFDGDGKADLLWRNRSTGENYIFFMNGKQVVTANEGYIRTIGDQDWQVAGVGDIGGGVGGALDGKADIVWHNRSTGETYVYFMDGKVVLPAEGFSITVVDTAWSIVAVADFDGDGRADLLWRNAYTGENYIHLMNADLTVKAASGYIRPVPDQAWQPVGAGDFDGDGKADILWRNRATGESYIFFMTVDGTPKIAIDGGKEGYIRTVPDTFWQVATLGDYNGDGKADILWRHDATGENYMYLMDGKTVASEDYLRTVIAAWRPYGELSMYAGGTPGCSTTGASGSLTPSVTASRASGVAPLSVFFDATATTSGNVALPFHHIEYRWNFGDRGAGAWTKGTRPGSNSRNTAMGPVAAHVFNSAGTYRVCVSAYDGVARAAAQVEITVEDPEVVFAGDTKTACFSQSGNFDGCPANALQITQPNWVTALATAQNNNTLRRLLFRRGDTFTAGAVSGNVRTQGPGLIGAFGSASNPRPKVTGTSTTGIIQLSSNTFPTMADWRVVDFELDGTGGGLSSDGVYMAGGAKQLTFLRIDLHNPSIGFNFNWQDLDFLNTQPSTDGHEVWDQISVVDTTVRDMLDNAGFYLTSRRFALLGSSVEDVIFSVLPGANGGHTTRFPFLGKAVLSNNTLTHPTGGLQVIKLHAPPVKAVTGNLTAGSPTITNLSANAGDFFGVRVTHAQIPSDSFVTGSSNSTTLTMSKNASNTVAGAALTLAGVLPDFSEEIVIGDNHMIGTTDPAGTFILNIEPQSTSFHNERLRQIIVERNWFVSPNGQRAVTIDADNITVRNNICEFLTGSGSCISVVRERQLVHGNGADGVMIYHNTMYKAGSSSAYMVDLEDDETFNVTVHNNMAYAPTSGDRRMTTGFVNGLINTCGSCNSSNAQMGTNPNFAVNPPTKPPHYRPSGAYTNNSGIAVPVWSDFFRQPWPAQRDMGAFQH